LIKQATLRGCFDSGGFMVDINKRLNLIKGDVSAIGAAEKLKKAMDDAGKSVRTAFSNVPTTLQERLKSVGTAATNTSKEFEELRTNASAALRGIEAETTKTAATILGEFEKVGRADKIDKLAARFGSLAKEIGDAEGQARKLAAELTKIGASDAEIARASSTFNTFSGGAKEGSGAGLRRFGRELRNLPSTQIPGLGIGTDAIGNITRLSGALIDVSEKSALATAATKALTPVFGATAAAATASYAAIAVAALPLVAVVGVVAAAFKQASDQAEIANAASARFFAARNAQIDLIDTDMTEEQAKERLNVLRQEEEAKTALIADAATIREQTFAEAQRQATEVDGVLGDLSARIRFNLFEASGGFNDFNQDVDATKTSLTNVTAEIGALEYGLEQGVFAVNDTAAAIEELSQKQDQYVESLKAARTQVQSYTDQIDQLNQSFATQNTRTAITNIMQSIFDATEATITAAEKAEDATDARLEREDAYYERINQIQDQANQKAIDTAAAIGKLESDFDKQEASNRDKFRRDQLQKEREFRQREADIKLNYERDISEARLNFSVQDFMKADQTKADAERELERDRKKNRRESRRFEIEREEAKKTLDERIAALNTELETFKTNTQAKLDAEKAAFEESERKLEEREARNEKRADDRAARRAAFDEQMDNLRDKWAEEDHNAQLQRLSELNDTAVANYDAQRKALDQTTGAIDKAKAATDQFSSSVDALFNIVGTTLNKVKDPFSPLPAETGTVPGGSSFPLLPPDPNIGGGTSPTFNAISSLGRERSPLANPAAFANRGSGGGGRNNVTLQVNVSGNAFGNVWTQDQADAMAADIAAKIDLKQIETIDVVGMAINNKSRVT
jgi:hypothetical protein